MNSYKAINNYYVIMVALSGREQLKTGELEGGMLRPSPNHETLWLPNDDDDGCMNPPNVSTCSGQRLLTKDSNVKFNKMQNVLS